MPFRVTRSWAAVALAACSAVAITGSAIAVPPSRSYGAIQLTGRQLAASLVPASALPRGYQVARSLQQDSGSRLETAAAKYDLATMSCATIYDDYGRAGFGESALAEVAYVKVSSLLLGTGTATGLFQQVYQFRSGKAAASYWRGLRAATIRCPGLGAAADPDQGKITQRVLAVRYGRDQAFEADVTETGPPYGSVNTAVLVVVAGDYVFTVDIVGYGRPVPADPSARALMSELVARVHAAG
jgi:hypothetical protein